jgi:hypothetical protein
MVLARRRSDCDVFLPGQQNHQKACHRSRVTAHERFLMEKLLYDADKANAVDPRQLPGSRTYNRTCSLQLTLRGSLCSMR